jgi:hypothetical protein
MQTLPMSNQLNPNTEPQLTPHGISTVAVPSSSVHLGIGLLLCSHRNMCCVSTRGDSRIVNVSCSMEAGARAATIADVSFIGPATATSGHSSDFTEACSNHPHEPENASNDGVYSKTRPSAVRELHTKTSIDHAKSYQATSKPDVDV